MSKIYWLNKDSVTFLKNGYLKENQSPEERIREICDSAEKILKIDGFADKLEKYIHKGWISFSSPVWTNFGNNRGLPISCNGSFVSDTIDSILEKAAEIGTMTKYGAGTSAYFGELRPRGAKISVGGMSSGPVHFMEIFNTVTSVVSQSNIRRGNVAAYLPIDHSDILEFLQIRSSGHPIQNISLGVCIKDKWMQEMVDGNKEKRKIWGKVIQKRFESGYPYLFFTDTVNNNKPKVYKDKNLAIYASNLCSEINLPSSPDESFVCNLSALNLLHFDEWRETDVIETCIYFLDAVMEEYIEKTSNIPFMKPAHNFAKRHRALGLGVLGWHSLLQSREIPFESMEAKFLNTKIFKLIEEKCDKATAELAEKYGEPDLLKGYGIRNTTTRTLMPTTSSSFILGQISPSIEPLNSNYFIKDLQKGKFTYRNPFLLDLLEGKRYNNDDVWQSILEKGGSVQHLGFLSEKEKDVYKTFGEISQKEIIIQASQRQKYIDQSQSLNIMIHHKTPPKQVNQLIIEAWKMGVKTLYYQRSTNPALELTRSIIECKSCEI